MKKKLILCCAVSACVFLPRLFPVIWKNTVSLPWLSLANLLGGRLPFSLLEWGLASAAAWTAVSFVKNIARGKPMHALKSLGKRLLSMLLAAAMLFSAVWLPLYENMEFKPASAARLAACSEKLIALLNESPPDFSRIPEDLPAKTAIFPFWMRGLKLLGFYSFFTGEALISPDIPPPLLPFVSVHERIHGQGIAHEGLCNIRAYEECLLRGGPYAGSARVWALKYLLGELRSADYAAYAKCCGRMNENTRELLMQSGGIYERKQGGILSAFSGAGSVSGYEILAHHLAAEMDG